MGVNFDVTLSQDNHHQICQEDMQNDGLRGLEAAQVLKYAAVGLLLFLFRGHMSHVFEMGLFFEEFVGGVVF